MSEFNVFDGKNLYFGLPGSTADAKFVYYTDQLTVLFGLLRYMSQGASPAETTESLSSLICRSIGNIVKIYVTISANTLDGITIIRTRRHKSLNTVHQNGETEVSIPPGSIVTIESNVKTPYDDDDLFNLMIDTSLSTVGSIVFKVSYVMEYEPA